MASTRMRAISNTSLAQLLAIGASLLLSLSACGGAQKTTSSPCCDGAKKKDCCDKGAQGGKDCEKGGKDCEKGGKDCDKSGKDCEKGGKDCDKSGKDCEKGGKDCDKSGKDCEKGGKDCDKGGKDCDKGGKDCDKAGKDCGKDCDKSGKDCDKGGKDCGKDCGKSGKDCDKGGKDCDKAGKDCDKGAATSAGAAGAEAALVLITAEALQSDLKAGTAGTVVDVNSKERYLQGHVAGAIHANHRALTRADLPEDLAGRLVFYCGSAKCMASHEAARTALALGYKRVEVMSDGIKGWEAKGLPTSKEGNPLPFGILSAADLQQKMQAAMQVHVFDVNSEERFRQGHVTGARNVSLTAFDRAELPPGKDAFVVFYCGSPKCGASHKAAKLAAARGYTNLWVMTDGIKGWEAAGLPTEK